LLFEGLLTVSDSSITNIAAVTIALLVREDGDLGVGWQAAGQDLRRRTATGTIGSSIRERVAKGTTKR